MTDLLCVPDPARCREVDPDLWHSGRASHIAAAKETCNRCEAKADCLQAGMAVPDGDMWGVWGGLTAAARRALRAADPDRWPVRVADLEELLGSRIDRFGAERFTPDQYRGDTLRADDNGVYRDPDGRARVPWGEYDGPVRPPVDWAADACSANAEALLDRYPAEQGEPVLLGGELRYPPVTETGYALTDESGKVSYVNKVAA